MTGALTEGISVANATTAVISELLAGSADACKPSSYELRCAFLAARRLRSCADSMTYVIEFHMLSENVLCPPLPSHLVSVLRLEETLRKAGMIVGGD